MEGRQEESVALADLRASRHSTKNMSGKASNSPWIPLLEMPPNGIPVAGSCCQEEVQRLSEVGPSGKSVALWRYVCTQSLSIMGAKSLSFCGSLKSRRFLLGYNSLPWCAATVLAEAASQPVRIGCPWNGKQNNCFLFTSWWSQTSAIVKEARVLATLKKNPSRLGRWLESKRACCANVRTWAWTPGAIETLSTWCELEFVIPEFLQGDERQRLPSLKALWLLT